MPFNRVYAFAAGAVLAALCGGCQTFSRDRSIGEGPSRSFGLNYVPRQSEPPIADAGRGVKTASHERPAASAELDAPAAENAAKPAKSLARMMPGRDKRAPDRLPLPVTSRTEAASDVSSEIAAEADEN